MIVVCVILHTHKHEQVNTQVGEREMAQVGE